MRPWRNTTGTNTAATTTEMPVETPEVVTDGLTVLERDLGVPTAAVACQMRVQPRLLQDLLGVDEHGSGPSVVPLLRAGRPGDAATDGARAHRRSVVVVSGKAADIQLIKHVSDAVGELLGINQHSGRLTRSTSSLWVETARRMLSEVPTW